MKNYVQVWVVVVWDTGVNALFTVGALESAQEALDFASQWVAPLQPTITMYYFKLSKYALCNPLIQTWLTFAAPIDSGTKKLVPSDDFYVQTSPFDWNVDDPLWKTDGSDKATVKATQIAKTTLANKASNRKASVILQQGIAPALLQLSEEFMLQGFRLTANELLRLRQDFISGKVTQAQALFLLEGILKPFQNL